MRIEACADQITQNGDGGSAFTGGGTSAAHTVAQQNVIPFAVSETAAAVTGDAASTHAFGTEAKFWCERGQNGDGRFFTAVAEQSCQRTVLCGNDSSGLPQAVLVLSAAELPFERFIDGGKETFGVTAPFKEKARKVGGIGTATLEDLG